MLGGVEDRIAGPKGSKSSGRDCVLLSRSLLKKPLPVTWRSVVRSRDARRRSATANRDVQLRSVGRTNSSGSSVAWGEETGGRGIGRDVEGVRRTVLGGGAAIDSAGAVTAGIAAAGVLFGAQRAAADGAVELQPAFPLVRGIRDR